MAAGYSPTSARSSTAHDVTAVVRHLHSRLAAVTDAAGKASVTVHRDRVKGPETVKAVVDWAGNPHNGPRAC